MTHTTWELLDKKIVLNGEVLPLPFPATKAIEVSGILVVLLEPPRGTINNRNVIGIGADGKMAWEIQESPHGGEKDQPFVDIKQGPEGTVIARNWNGVEYELDPVSGKINTVGFRRF